MDPAVLLDILLHYLVSAVLHRIHRPSTQLFLVSYTDHIRSFFGGKPVVSNTRLFQFQFWLLSVTSLYKCLYTRPPLIPEQYSVPPKMIKLLSKRDQREFGPDVDLSTDPLSHSSGASTNSDSDSGSNYKSNQEKQKDSQWETFYRQLTDLAINKRKLNVRTT